MKSEGVRLVEGFDHREIPKRPSLQPKFWLAAGHGGSERGTGARQQATDGEEEKRKAFHIKKENGY